MIQKSTLAFLKSLAAHNDREWFAAHKPAYEAAKADAEHLAAALAAGIAQFDPSIGYLEPKDCMFRIYRDARFSHDKSPYKTNLGVVLQRGGKRTQYACYYVHIEPNNLFLSGGIYMPSPEVLKALRHSIDVNFEEFESIVHNKSFKKYFALEGEKLVKAPQGFDKDSPAVEYLKHKNWYVMQPIDAAEICHPDFVKKTLKAFAALQPLNAFFNEAIDEM
ncbi:TIGR02453 family protein [Bacteroidia bacterium]|nr:TIGR02453 family protein [Bacteroidia bacterium]